MVMPQASKRWRGAVEKILPAIGSRRALQIRTDFFIKIKIGAKGILY
jgi:hypothetical protein